MQNGKMVSQARSAHFSLDLAGDLLNFLPCLPGIFDDKYGAGIALDKKAVPALFNISLCAFQDIVIDELTCTGPVFKSNEIGPKRFIYRIKVHA